MVEYRERVAFNNEIPLEARASLLTLQQKRPVEEILLSILKNSSEFEKHLRNFEDMEINRCKRTLTILNIHFAVDFNLLNLLFEDFGEILSIYIFKDRVNEKLPGFCTIEFCLTSSAESAIKCMQDFVVYGLALKIFQTEHIQSVRSLLIKQNSLPPAVNIPPSSSPSLFSPLFANSSMLSNYNPSRIYIGSIPWDMTEKEVTQLFTPFGKILKLEMMPNPETGKHRGFAFLVFEALSSAYKAIQAMNNFSVKGQKLRVNFQSSASPLTASTATSAAGQPGGVASPSSLLSLPSSGPPAKPVVPAHSPVLLLRNMVTSEADFDDETREEITKECSKFGLITELLAKTVTVNRKDEKGEKSMEKEKEKEREEEEGENKEKEFRIFLVYSREEDAVKAVKGLNGRWYAQRMVDASAYDYEAYLKKEYEL